MKQDKKKPDIGPHRSAPDHQITHNLPNMCNQSRTIHSLCLILPFKNEQENIEIFVRKLLEEFNQKELLLEILLVDDGSTDNSLNIAKLLSEQFSHVNYISLSRNFGKEAAIMAGLHECGDNFDAVAYMDSDGQHTAEDLSRLVEEAQPHNIDIVCGVRADRSYQSTVQRIMAKAFYKVFQAIGNTNIDEGAGDFNVLKMKAVLALRQMSEPRPFMKGIIGWVGFRKKLVPIYILPRAGGRAKSSTHSMLNLAFGALISFSSWPLRVWSAVGIASSFIAILYLLFVTIKTVLFGVEVPGYATTIVLLLGLGGIQLLSIGIVGEYVARVYDAVQKRPRYIISERSDN